MIFTYLVWDNIAEPKICLKKNNILYLTEQETENVIENLQKCLREMKDLKRKKKTSSLYRRYTSANI